MPSKTFPSPLHLFLISLACSLRLSVPLLALILVSSLSLFLSLSLVIHQQTSPSVWRKVPEAGGGQSNGSEEIMAGDIKVSFHTYLTTGNNEISDETGGYASVVWVIRTLIHCFLAEGGYTIC